MAARTTNRTNEERGQEKLRAAIQTLEAGIGAILDGEGFARYLRALARFHTYSANNVMLILAQNPDATRVAGYKAWQDLGRQVRKGERGLVILVPLARRVRDEEGGEEEGPRIVTGFGIGHVFDLGQTDGEPLPVPPAVEAITAATDRGAAVWAALESWLTAQGVSVTVADCGRPNGYYRPSSKAIVVHERLRGTDGATKTLAHEAAHHVANHHALVPAGDAETVAEGAAYVVLSHFGLDAAGYSFPYVARWAEDKAVLRRNLDVIRQVAGTIIAGIEAATVDPAVAGLAAD